jgi:predicted metal-dependent phosphoesterase TrpH
VLSVLSVAKLVSVVKVELHAHTDQDPADRIGHTTNQLIDHAASLGYGAMAITLHDRYFDPTRYAAYARERGVVLLAGVERTLDRRHVLLINFPKESAEVRSFADIAALKRRSNGLVVAPHPFYPLASALGSTLDRERGVIDAVEVNAMFIRGFDFNRRALAWAKTNGVPLVGNTDLHLLEQMGTTYSLVDADPDPDAICEAIRQGRVEVRREPLNPVRAAWLFARMVATGLRPPMPARVDSLEPPA